MNQAATRSKDLALGWEVKGIKTRGGKQVQAVRICVRLENHSGGGTG